MARQLGISEPAGRYSRTRVQNPDATGRLTGIERHLEAVTMNFRGGGRGGFSNRTFLIGTADVYAMTTGAPQGGAPVG